MYSKNEHKKYAHRPKSWSRNPYLIKVDLRKRYNTATVITFLATERLSIKTEEWHFDKCLSNESSFIFQV